MEILHTQDRVVPWDLSDSPCSTTMLMWWMLWVFWFNLTLILSDHFMMNSAITTGVLASRFPISIKSWVQGQHRCWSIKKILKNHVPASDFATRLLNLENLKNNKNFAKKNYFFFVKNAIWYQRNTFQDTIFQSLIFAFLKKSFWCKIDHKR